MVSANDVKNIAIIGGIAATAFIIWRAGRDLFNVLPQIPNIEFPDFNFPEINFPNPFSGEGQEQIQDAVDSATDVTQDIVSDEFTNVPEEDRTPVDALGAGLGGAFGGISEFFNSLLGDVNQNQPEIQGPIGPLQEERPLDLTQLVENLRPQVAPDNASIPVPQGVEHAFGGGPSFIGGQIFPDEIDTLAEVIDEFNVPANIADDILAELQGDDFDGFDFGTNTGILNNPELAPSLPSQGAVSNPEFTGLSAEEIMQRILGGNINKF